MNNIAKYLHACATACIWLFVEDSDVGLVAVVRSMRVLKELVTQLEAELTQDDE